MKSAKILVCLCRKAEKINSGNDSERPVGRPRIESLQPGLLEAIEAIASADGAADPRRRSQMIVIPKTLDDLTASLVTRGYNLKCVTFVQFFRGFCTKVDFFKKFFIQNVH